MVANDKLYQAQLKVQEFEQREKELRERKKAALKKVNEIKRKERTHRLIVLGGIIEKYCGEISEEEAFEEYIKKYSNAIKKHINFYNSSEMPLRIKGSESDLS